MMLADTSRKAIRVDLQIIADMIEPHSRVLDVGCGNGVLLDYLVNFKQVDGRGLELSTDGVNACVSTGAVGYPRRCGHGPCGLSRQSVRLCGAQPNSAGHARAEIGA